MSSSRLRVFSSSVGTKILIGFTGLALVLYLIVHIVGNLMVFGGPDVFNRYAYTLEGNPLIPQISSGLATGSCGAGVSPGSSGRTGSS